MPKVKASDMSEPTEFDQVPLMTAADGLDDALPGRTWMLWAVSEDGQGANLEYVSNAEPEAALDLLEAWIKQRRAGLRNRVVH